MLLFHFLFSILQINGHKPKGYSLFCLRVVYIHIIYIYTYNHPCYYIPTIPLISALRNFFAFPPKNYFFKLCCRSWVVVPTVSVSFPRDSFIVTVFFIILYKKGESTDTGSKKIILTYVLYTEWVGGWEYSEVIRQLLLLCCAADVLGKSSHFCSGI